jgi:hypothetical protein
MSDHAQMLKCVGKEEELMSVVELFWWLCIWSTVMVTGGVRLTLFVSCNIFISGSRALLIGEGGILGVSYHWKIHYLQVWYDVGGKGRGWKVCEDGPEGIKSSKVAPGLSLEGAEFTVTSN